MEGSLGNPTFFFLMAFLWEKKPKKKPKKKPFGTFIFK